jgi:alkanesulfonate monooxygenase SsuD/methylene tetrahydromethanopterin reductase-like flavin-dependent oxidoreductase (luciferase family)
MNQEELAQLRADGRVRVGYCLPTFAWPGSTLFRTPNLEAVDPADAVRLARDAEAAGFDSVWACDHLMLGKDNAVLEGWTVLSVVAGATTRVQLGLIHQANVQRIPSLHANMTATLDQLSGGRFVFFPDMSTYAAENVAYGLDWDDDADVRAAKLAEALEIILSLWTAEEPVSFSGQYYRVEAAQAHPRPAQRPHPPLWFGEVHPAQLAICARYGDGWNSTPVRTDELRRRVASLEAACLTFDRSPDDIEKSYETQVLVCEDHETLREKLRQLLSRPGFPGDDLPGQRASSELLDYVHGRRRDLPEDLTDTWIIGTPEEARARVAQLREVGIDHLLLWFMDAPDRAGMRLFMSDVHVPWRAASVPQ